MVSSQEDNVSFIGKQFKEGQPVPLLALFSFSSKLDRLFILIGILAAITIGSVFPIGMTFYADIIGAFVAYTSKYEIMMTNTSLYNESNFEENKDLFRKELLKCSLEMFGLGLTNLILCYFMVVTLNSAAKHQTHRMRLKFFESVLRQDMSWFDVKGSKDFATKVTSDLQMIQQGIGEKIGLSIYFVSISIFSVAIAIYRGWKLALMLLAIVPIITIANGIVAKIQTTMSMKESKTYATAGAIAEEVIGAIRTVFAFGGESKEVDRYANSLKSAKVSGIRRGFFTGLSGGVMWFSVYSSFGFGLWYGSKLIMWGEYEPNQALLVFVNMLVGGYFFGQASPHLEALSMARGAATGILNTIRRRPEIINCASLGKRPEKVQGRIEFKHVFFNYPARPDVTILQGMNITIEPGQTVALVGSSGCGKSTILQLIQRLYDPAYGQVLLDGNPIKDLNLGWLRDQIGTVGQEPVLFATTIKENIRLGHLLASDSDIVAAAKEANAHDFITKLPLGYETVLGEKGAQISGGQKQRIAIARALIKRPKILLLDEATSALDLESESVVQAALEKASVGRTTLIVAHRLSTIQNADNIIVMDKGEVKESGTHKELIEKKGFYYNLISAQHHVLEDECDEILVKNELERQRTLSLIPVVHDKTTSTTELNAVKEVAEEESQSMRALLKMVFNYKIFLFIGVIAAILNGLSIPVYSILYGDLIGAWRSPERMKNETTFYGAMFVVLGIVAGLACVFQSYMFGIIGENITMKLRRRLFEAYLRQETAWFDEPTNGVGALCARLSSDTSAVQGASGTRISITVQAFAMITAIVALSFYYNWKMGIVGLIMCPLALVAGIAETKIARQSLEGDTKSMENSTKVAVEALSNIRTIVSLRLENHFYTLFKEELEKSMNTSQIAAHARGVVLGFSQGIVMMTYGIMMYYGGYLVMNNEADYSSVLKVSEVTLFGASQLGQILSMASDFTKGKVAARNIFKLIDRKPKIDKISGKKLMDFQGNIKFESVFFSYPRRQEALILNGLRVTLETGKTTALVGSSGCGKSTCIQLLQRFYEVDRGRVLIDDHNIIDLNVGWLRSKIGLVQQEPTLFNYSIQDNIAYGDNAREVPIEEIVKAAEKANIHSFIQSLPAGYLTNVGDCGNQLSGGQKQRIAIARAMVRNPTILLLDEATSALDSESEKIVQETLNEAMKGRTCVVIAHRLSTVQNADKIVVIKDGQVVEQGTHHDLIRRQGAYFELLNKQN